MFYKILDQQVELKILAKPNAKKSALLSISEHGLHVALHAKPHQGEANEELIAYLAKIFKVPKTLIVMKRGEGSRHKWLTLPLNETLQNLIDDPEEFLQGILKK